MKTWLLDTGPLVALLVGDDTQHEWATEQLKRAPTTVLTCDAVISEASYLLQRDGYPPDDLFAMVETGFIRSDFSLQDEHWRIRELMRRYHLQSMDFADACLVRMAELQPNSLVWTHDSDFNVYRMNRRDTIPLVAPWHAHV